MIKHLYLSVSPVLGPMLDEYLIECYCINWSSCFLVLLWRSESENLEESVRQTCPLAKDVVSGSSEGTQEASGGSNDKWHMHQMHRHNFWVNCLGELCHWIFLSSNVTGERKKLKAQVELLQPRNPPNPKKKGNPETKARCKKKRGSIAYILNFLPWKNINRLPNPHLQ